MKTLIAAASAAALLVPLTASAGVVDWTAWNPSSSATGTTSQNGNPVTVTYDGDFLGIDFAANYFSNLSSFTSPEVSNTVGSNGSIRMDGGGTALNHIHFSMPVTNPYIAVYSVGQPNVPVRFVFQSPVTLTLLSQGAGNWGGGTLALDTASSFTGYEGNGVLRMNGTFTDIYFSTPDPEYYYGFTVGLANTVSEPASMALMLGGLSLVTAAMRRRRKP
jgi:hypothetical protein